MTDSMQPRMDWGRSDPVTAVKLFKQKCELYFSVKDVKQEKQVDHLLLFSGEQGLKTFNSWGLSQEDSKKPDIVWKRFETQIEPKSNFRVARLYLQKYKQQENENIDDFMSRCKLQALKDELKDRLIEQLISGTRHQELQKDLLGKDKTLTIDKAVDTARTYEASIEHMKQFQNIETKPIQKAGVQVNSVNKSNTCLRCGGKNHPKSKCPAIGKDCSICGKKDHFKSVCLSLPENRSRLISSPHTRPTHRARTPGRHKPHQKSQSRDRKEDSRHRSKIYTMCEDKPFPEDQFNRLTIGVVNGMKSPTRDEAFTTMHMKLAEKKTIVDLNVKVDTGAQGNYTLPIRMYRAMFPENLNSEGYPKRGAVMEKDTVLTAYNGSNIPDYGTITRPCKYRGDWIDTEVFIVESLGPAIIGLPASQDLNLLTLHCGIEKRPSTTPISTVQGLKQQYPNQVDRIGHFPCTYHITLKDDSLPVVHAPRKFPIHIRDELKAKLDSMESQGVIKRVTAPTDWVNSMVTSRNSNGKLRVCLDPKDLNKCIKRSHHKTPTLEEMTYQLSGAQFFSKLDAKNGYWSVVLDESSALLTTFNTPFGQYYYQRMPFGLVMSQDVFQAKMDQFLENCPGTIGIADDVTVFGWTEEEHDLILHNLIKVASQYGLVFNSEKCHIKESQVKFFGVIYDKNGADPGSNSRLLRRIYERPWCCFDSGGDANRICVKISVICRRTIC